MWQILKNFSTIGIRNKTSEACIDGTGQVISKFSTFGKNVKKISHIRSVQD